MEYIRKSYAGVSCPWWHYAEVESTNTQAGDIVRDITDVEDSADYDAVRFVVSADKQTAGRGRTGHQWVSVPGINCAVSYICELSQEWYNAHGTWISTVAGLCVAQAVESVYKLDDIKLKWPNDIYAKGRKLGGILCEVVERDDAPEKIFVIIGIGINIEAAPRIEANYEATCIRELAELAGEMATIDSASADALIVRIAGQLNKFFSSDNEKNLHAVDTMHTFREQALRRSYTVGRRVVVRRVDSTEIFGKAVNIGLDASLEILDDSTRQKVNVRVGDVGILP
ncbi:biotin--[acetyl-CoA-carboxylase] ligase [Alloscardovia venturai]|uniref:Biotin--[acetyl-CoA-carboxylase] ligase n=1 Tax=Alloscardovia venturai TaxID=1769421 RepID=A0ABW2Y707_9BIFI